MVMSGALPPIPTPGPSLKGGENGWNEPQVVVAMREFKAGLLAHEQDMMREMAERWVMFEVALEADIELLAEEMAQRRADGRSVTRGQVARMERYRRLLAQTQVEMGRYAGYVERVVSRGQADLARLGVEQAAEAIRLSAADGVGVYFDRLPIEKVEMMAGMAGNGKPLGELLKLRMVKDESGQVLPGVWERLTGTLVRGTAMGWHPRKTAASMRKDLAGGLQKALVIARSEQLRVYREATVGQYRESGVVRAQMRLAAHDMRVCAACLAEDGKEYALEAAIFDHPQGRCTSVPVLKGEKAPKWLQGEDWLRTQAEEVQRSILGEGRFAAWKAGKVRLSDMAMVTDDVVWGKGLRVRPLNEMVQIDQGREA